MHTSKTDNPPWDIVEAATFIRKFEKDATECGYCLCLGGGTLTKGFSMNDLDIICLRRTDKQIHEMKPTQLLDAFTLRQETKIVYEETSHIEQHGPHVLVFMREKIKNRRIELWFPHHFLVLGELFAVK